MKCYQFRTTLSAKPFMTSTSKLFLGQLIILLTSRLNFIEKKFFEMEFQSSIANSYEGGPKKPATTPEMVRKVKARLERNPRRSGRKMAKELKISQNSIRRILKKAPKSARSYTVAKKVRWERASDLLRMHESGQKFSN